MVGVELAARAEHVLTAPLTELVEAGAAVPGAVVGGWALPGGAGELLARNGLPRARDDGYVSFVGDFQVGFEPEWELDGQSLYRLGWYGVSHLGVRSGDGDVVVFGEPFDPHPDLGLSSPQRFGPELVNGTVDRLVECAWRWHWLLPVMAELQRRIGEAELTAVRTGAAPDLVFAWEEVNDRTGERILHRFRELDPGFGEQFWSGVIFDG